MKNKFNFRQSQILKENIASDNKQVKLLIIKLNKLQEDYYKNAYVLLNAILVIRQRQIKGYKSSDLARERGIELSTHSIQYIFGYRYLSKNTLTEIDKGHLKVGTALYIVRQNEKLREPSLQDKVVKYYMDGKITTCDLGIMGINAIEKGVINNKSISQADKHLNNIYLRIRHISQMVNCERGLFNNIKTIDKIRKSIQELDNDLRIIGDKLRKPRKVGGKE